MMYSNSKLKQTFSSIGQSVLLQQQDETKTGIYVVIAGQQGS